MQIKELNSKEEILKSFEVLSQIYEELKADSYVQEVLNMMQRGYKMAAVFEDENIDDGKCIGVVGVRVARKLQYGKILEIEDFMICRNKRGVGVGKMLVRWVEWQAMNFDCNSMVCNLDSARLESHKILAREHFLLEGFKFRK
jgi:GNAT superfamily N-acetyltransferase